MQKKRLINDKKMYRNKINLFFLKKNKTSKKINLKAKKKNKFKTI